ncbi:unnamed protein product [Mesocestoides corti]|uniref:Exonuclease domain-containing protein n=1 Tax=Mesocestoides corti TaxID=53468 RepID=A0A0R3UQ41_MESCO|nr:unnamed protein product [Mesocestoides corti]
MHQDLLSWEIIEFPVLLLNAHTLQEVDRFHRYVRPVHHPKLSDFCTQLTGIIQDMVDFQAEFPVVLKDFEDWINGHFPTDEDKSSFAFVTCGDWDLGHMLPQQASLAGCSLPAYCRRWINIKQACAEYLGRNVGGLLPMLRALNLPHTGRHHSGINDCLNIANILRCLVAAKAHLRFSG